MKFISKEECEMLGTRLDEELLNEILSRVYNAAIEKAITKLPEVVSRMVASTTATQAMTNDFFKRNKDFENHKEIVASVIQEIDSQNPGMNYDEILKDAESIIIEKIIATYKKETLQLDKPSEVNLKGNGVL